MLSVPVPVPVSPSLPPPPLPSSLFPLPSSLLHPSSSLLPPPSSLLLPPPPSSPFLSVFLSFLLFPLCLFFFSSFLSVYLLICLCVSLFFPFSCSSFLSYCLSVYLPAFLHLCSQKVRDNPGPSWSICNKSFQVWDVKCKNFGQYGFASGP